MSLSKFIVKLSVKAVVIVILAFILGAVLPSIGTIITNQMALGQMESSDIMYVAMNVYTKFRPIVAGIMTALIVWIGATVCLDAYRVIKEFEKEN